MEDNSYLPLGPRRGAGPMSPCRVDKPSSGLASKADCLRQAAVFALGPSCRDESPEFHLKG